LNPFLELAAERSAEYFHLLVDGRSSEHQSRLGKDQSSSKVHDPVLSFVEQDLARE